jgi:integrase
MATMKLTKASVDRLAANTADTIHWDSELKGFGVKITPKGRKVFMVQYRPAGSIGNARKFTIGTHGEFAVEQARRKAHEVIAAKARGEDPQQVKRHEKRRIATDRFTDVLDRFIEQHVMQTRSAQETERLLRREFAARWRSKSVHDVRKADIIEILDGIMERGSPVMANRTLAAIRKFFNWCISKAISDASPCAGVTAFWNESARDRVLTDDELRLVILAARRDGFPFGSIVEMLALTGQRREETARVAWAQIDLKNAVWTIPSENAKNGKAHSVHLSEAAQHLIAHAPELGELAFSTDGKTVFQGWSRAVRRLKTMMIEIQTEDSERQGGSAQKVKPIPDWRLHDLRRTVVSGMASLKVAPHVADKILNHKSGVISGVAAVYQRHEFLEDRKIALTIWANHVAQLLDAR